MSKNGCETKAFKRLAERLKKEYPRLPVCVLVDSLYASKPVFEKCIRDNGCHVPLRYKEGSIPAIAEEYRSIAGMGGGLEAGLADCQGISPEREDKGKTPYGMGAGDRLPRI